MAKNHPPAPATAAPKPPVPASAAPVPPPEEQGRLQDPAPQPVPEPAPVRRERRYTEGQHKAFRADLIAFDANRYTFTNFPPPKLRLNIALQKLLAARSDLQAAQAVMAQLKGEVVTGTGKSGAQFILGDEEELYDLLLEHGEATFDLLTGKALDPEDLDD